MKGYWTYNTYTKKFEYVKVDDETYAELKRIDWREEKHKKRAVQHEICFSQLDIEGFENHENYDEFVRLSESVEENVINAEMQTELQNAIDSLEQLERKIIIGIFFENKTEREVADEMGISQKTVNKYKRKILLKLKNILEQKG